MLYLATTSLIAVWCTLEVASHRPFQSPHRDFVPTARLMNGVDDGLQTNSNQGEDKKYEFLISTNDHIRCERCYKDGHIDGRVFMKAPKMIVKYQASKVDDDHHQILGPEQGVEPPQAMLNDAPVNFNQNPSQPNVFYQPQGTPQAPIVSLAQRANNIMAPAQQFGNPVGTSYSLNPQLANIVIAPPQQSDNPVVPPYSQNPLLANYGILQSQQSGSSNIPPVNPQLTTYVMQLGRSPPQYSQLQGSLLNVPKQAMQFSNPPSSQQVTAGPSNIGFQSQPAQPFQLPQHQASERQSELIDFIFSKAIQGATSGDTMTVGTGGNENPLHQSAANYVSMGSQLSPAINGNGNPLGGIARYTLVNGDIGNGPRHAAANYVLPQVAQENANGNQLGGLARFTLVSSNGIDSRNVLSQIQQPSRMISQPLNLQPDGSYTFSIDDVNQSRYEKRDSRGKVMGRYAYITPDNNLQEVKYVADEKGYRPHVQAPVPVINNVASQVSEDRPDQMALQSMPEINSARAMPFIVLTDPQTSAKSAIVEGSTAPKAKDSEAERKELMEQLADSLARLVNAKVDNDEAPVAVKEVPQSPAPLK